MKNNFKFLILAVTLALALACFTSCEEAINGLADKINDTTCKLFGHAMDLEGYKEATCTEEGFTGSGVCSICGYEQIGEVVEMKEHSWVDATCLVAKYCVSCELVEGEALGHSLVDVEAKAATCYENGYSKHKACERCEYAEDKEVYNAAHSFATIDVSGILDCTVCDFLQASSTEGLVYAITNAEDGATVIVKAGTYDGISFTNPDSYKAKNLTVVGEDGAVILGISFNSWSPVENSLVLDGLTLKNLTFDGKGLLLSTVSMSNVTVENCKFINDACIHQNDSSEKLTGLTVKSCTFAGDGVEGTTTAIMLENAENVKVSGCAFTNIDFNVLQAGIISGSVLIDGNVVSSTGDRVFRFVTVNADITISNNTIISNGDADGQLAKATSECEITLTNNTWNGLSDADVADKLINITSKQAASDTVEPEQPEDTGDTEGTE